MYTTSFYTGKKRTGEPYCLCKLGREWYKSMSFTPDELQALNTILDQKTSELLHELEQLFDRKMQSMRKEFAQYQQRLEESIDRSFATQLLAFEQLINQHFPAAVRGEPQLLHAPVAYTDLPQANFEAIEVLTEITW